MVCLLALLAATFGLIPFCDAHSASGIEGPRMEGGGRLGMRDQGECD